LFDIEPMAIADAQHLGIDGALRRACLAHGRAFSGGRCERTYPIGIRWPALPFAFRFGEDTFDGAQRIGEAGLC
jgi:hypothetical protein